MELARAAKTLGPAKTTKTSTAKIDLYFNGELIQDLGHIVPEA